MNGAKRSECNERSEAKCGPFKNIINIARALRAQAPLGPAAAEVALHQRGVACSDGGQSPSGSMRCPPRTN